MTSLTTNDRKALRDAAWEALGRVLDPELDEPITDLGFVCSCRVDADGTARIRLHLPTYFCPPNFVFLMVADARDAVSGVPGVSEVDVVLDDHFAADVINSGVAGGRGFVDTFADLAVSELGQLRVDFLRKAILTATDRACQALLTGGYSVEALAGLILRDLPPSPELQRLQDRRKQLGLPAGDNAPLVIDPITGRGISLPDLPMHLRRARLTRVSTEANGEICRNLLRGRYPETTISIRSHRKPEIASPTA
jgi:metal-sulfur cluster biosynthetic enzyme